MKNITWSERAVADLQDRLQRLERRHQPTRASRNDGSARPTRWAKTTVYGGDVYPTGPAHQYRVQFMATDFDRNLIGLDYGGMGITAIGDGSSTKHFRVARCIEPMLIPQGTLVPISLRYGQWYIDAMPAPRVQFTLAFAHNAGAFYGATVVHMAKGYVGLAGVIPGTNNKILVRDDMGCLADGIEDGNAGWATWVRAWTLGPQTDVASGHWSIDSLCCGV